MTTEYSGCLYSEYATPRYYGRPRTTLLTTVACAPVVTTMVDARRNKHAWLTRAASEQSAINILPQMETNRISVSSLLTAVTAC